jgi:2-succinyl-5-enolpyruvyl-6-hydroxy-3-cyclohexene-1-carboxylate synthase
MYVGALVDELVRSGVRHFCVCPGSRSTPLALAIARHASARLWMHLDERAAGFFALGMAKASREPVALVCTSGTAAANFMPAVVEAFYARIPLVVLTADRPHELRDAGAPQTIDQIDLFGKHAKWFVDLAEPDTTPEMLRYVRTVAGRAAALARRGPAGPVHLNCPFREPLVSPIAPEESASEQRPAAQPYVGVAGGLVAPEADLVATLAAELRAIARGLIVCGPQNDPALAAPLARLAGVLGYPILADPLSGLRCGPHDGSHVLGCYDAVLREPSFVERLAPDVVLRFGAMPTSKPVLQYLQRHAGCRQIVVDGEGGWNEPTLLASDVFHVDGRLLCEALLSHREHRGRGDEDADVTSSVPSVAESASWLDAWVKTDRAAGRVIAERLDAMGELFEGKVFAELAEILPDGALLYAGNSMPVRDMDTFFPGGERSIRMLANRGANGIDGVVSSALGANAATARPAVLVIGDLSFYHDANGLLAARQHGLDLVIVLINNDGGGIFSFLPQATATPEHFETLFGTPHGLDFRPLAETYGAHYTRADDWVALRGAIGDGLASGGLHVVELRTDRARNVTLHREMWRVVAAALKTDDG